MEMEASIIVFLFILTATAPIHVAGYWCVARSDAGDDALQAALDYACSAGADCVPLQSTGLCFLPNTLQAHASYAFNSLYQRKNMAAGSCDFAGTSLLAKTDPSYGSCIYPPNPSTAGLLTTGTTGPPTTQSTTPYGSVTPTTATPTVDGGSGLTPNTGPTIPTTTNDAASSLWFHGATFIAFIATLLIA